MLYATMTSAKRINARHMTGDETAALEQLLAPAGSGDNY